MNLIKYIGNKPTEDAFFAETGIKWTPGMTALVQSEHVWRRMLEHPDVFVDAGDVVIGTRDESLTTPVVIHVGPTPPQNPTPTTIWYDTSGE